MSEVTIKLVNEGFLDQFYVRPNQERTARSLLKDGWYTTAGTLSVPARSRLDAAEEVFDLTNNPARQAEREELYGRGRSVSVGDIVNVDGTDYLCVSVGWIRLDLAP